MSAIAIFQGVEKKVRLNHKVSDILEQFKIKSSLNQLSFKINNFELLIEMKTQTLQQLKVLDGNTIYISIKSQQQLQQQQLTQIQQTQQSQYGTILEGADGCYSDSFEELSQEQLQKQRNYQYAYAQSIQNNLIDQLHQYTYGKYNVQVEDFCRKVTIYSINQNFQVSFLQNKIFQTKNLYELDHQSKHNIQLNLNQSLIIQFFENQSGIHIKWVDGNYTIAYILI